MRFLNTTQTTAMGPAVGLEVGNSIYFDMPPDQFAYWNTDDAGRAMVQDLIRSGHIDCLHSYGDLATSRDHARRALDELARRDCRLEVWVDHSRAPTNFGADIMQGHGDEPGHLAYHADLTLSHGVRYVWRGRVTSVPGQNVRPRLVGLFTPRHPLGSSRTIATEWAKRLLARLGSEKYAMHASNQVLCPIRLWDGATVYEFLRSNPHWGGVSSADTARGIGEVLTEGFLCHLIRREGICILYTHLGKICDPRTPFDASAVAGLRRLAQAFREGSILVTTTRRALGFCRAVREVVFSVTHDGGILRINLETQRGGPLHNDPLPARDLDGLTFYVPDPRVCRILLNGEDVRETVCNPPDHTGRPSISMPWPRLEFPAL
jgi:hypothetical protein